MIITKYVNRITTILLLIIYISFQVLGSCCTRRDKLTKKEAQCTMFELVLLLCCLVRRFLRRGKTKMTKERTIFLFPLPTTYISTLLHFLFIPLNFPSSYTEYTNNTPVSTCKSTVKSTAKMEQGTKYPFTLSYFSQCRSGFLYPLPSLPSHPHPHPPPATTLFLL